MNRLLCPSTGPGRNGRRDAVPHGTVRSSSYDDDGGSRFLHGRSAALSVSTTAVGGKVEESTEDRGHAHGQVASVRERLDCPLRLPPPPAGRHAEYGQQQQDHRGLREGNTSDTVDGRSPRRRLRETNPPSRVVVIYESLKVVI